MQLRTILAATDESPDGRHAVHMARRLAASAGASLSVLRVLPVSGEAGKAAGRFVSNRTPERVASPDLEQFLQWLGPDALNGSLGVELVLAYGVPGVEISRLAEERGADLVVLGRRARSPTHRLLLGETAD